MKVGIFGNYSNGNFGDDLMGVIFAKYLKSLNLGVCLYSKSKVFKDKYGIPVISSLKEFLEQTDILIFGGGGILIPRKKSAGLNLFHNELEELYKTCNENRNPLYLISIGGYGLPLKKIYPEVRSKLLSASTAVTIRNPQDLMAVSQAGKKGKFYHDIVWTAHRFFPKLTSRSNNNKKIGVCLYFDGFFISRFNFLNSFLKYIIKKVFEISFGLNKNYEFIFIDIHNTTNEFSALNLSSKRYNYYERRFSDLEDDINFIQTLNLLITNRLHLGVVALSFGIPVINFSKENKILLFFKNCGLTHLNWNLRTGLLKLLYFFSSEKRTEKLFNLLENYDTQPMIDDAFNHFKELERMLGLVNTNQ